MNTAIWVVDSVFYNNIQIIQGQPKYGNVISKAVKRYCLIFFPSISTTYKDKALNKGLGRQNFLTRFLGAFELLFRSTFSLASFNFRLPTLSKDEKDREGKKTRSRGFQREAHYALMRVVQVTNLL